MIDEHGNYDEAEINLDFLHEVRTDLTVIGGYTSFMLDSRRSSLNEEQVESLDAIRKSYQKIINFTNAFTDFMRLKHNIWKFSKEDIDLIEILRNELDALKHIFIGEKIDLILDLPKEKAEIKGNSEAIGRAISYILTTSMKFLPLEDIKIFVTLLKEGNDWQCIIQNNGPGIPVDEIKNLFKPFYQSPNLFDGRKESGLGLIVAKEIFNLQKGNLGVQSELGQGVKISFSIPAKILKAPKRILIVEDNLVVAKMWARLLKEEFTIVISSSGKDALNKVKEEKFDLIILDILMSEMDGFEVYNRLKKSKTTAKIPIFFLSNLVQKDLGEKIKKLDVAGYFVKASLSPALLKEKIRKVFEKDEEEE